jgi:hypothetical protein
MINFNNGGGSSITLLIESYKAYKISKRMDELTEVMITEKKIVDSSFGDWDKVNAHLFKAKSTMKALRVMNKKLSDCKY